MVVLKKFNSQMAAFLYAAIVPIALGASSVTVVSFLPVLPGAAEKPAIKPTLSCHLGGFPRIQTNSDEPRRDIVQEMSDGTFTISNLTAPTLEVRLHGGSFSIQQLEQMHSESRPPPPWEDTKRATVRVTIDSISENQNEIPFLIGSSGGGSTQNIAHANLHFRLPIDEAEQRRQAEDYFHRLIEGAELDDPKVQHLVNRRDDVIRIYTSIAALQNQAGIYRISCSYSSEKGPWVGTIRAEPLILRIIFKKDILGLEKFRLTGNKE